MRVEAERVQPVAVAEVVAWLVVSDHLQQPAPKQCIMLYKKRHIGKENFQPSPFSQPESVSICTKSFSELPSRWFHMNDCFSEEV